MYRECVRQAVRELCWMRAGYRRAVILPTYCLDDVRIAAKELGIYPGVIFFSLEELEVAIITKRHSLIGAISARLFMEESIDEDESLRLLGWLCGYPKCCIKKFNRDVHFVVAYERYRKQCNRDPFDLRVWEDKHGWNWVFGYITHVPCKPTCAGTLRLYRKHKTLCENCKNQVCLRWK